MSFLLVGLVLSFAWASTIAVPVNDYTELEVDSKAILGDKYTENDVENAFPSGGYNLKVFLLGVLYGYKKCKETQPIPVTANDAGRYKPIFKYDGESHDRCYPDFATSSNNGKCRRDLSSSAPIYYQTTSCSGTTVYTYWHWYGWQTKCDCCSGAHDNDWEHISVYVRNNQADKVVFHQHAGHYTRRRGEFERSGERPVVYVGKASHGSYHIRCDGKEWWAPGKVTYCPGGCGYWDDFRNPGPSWSGVLYDLKPGQTIDGIKRPNRKICTSDIGTCVGASVRVLWTSGCWQNRP